MIKKWTSWFITIVLCFTFMCPSALAADTPTVSGTYADGVVTVSGEGFPANTQYPMIAILQPSRAPVAMDFTSADANGKFVLEIVTGNAFTDPTGYYVYVYDSNGKAVAYGSITVVSKEDETVTIILDLDGGTLPDGLTTTITFPIGETVDLSSYVPTKEGFQFLGWFDSESKVDQTTVFTNDTTVAAHWTYNGDSSSGSGSSGSGGSGGSDGGGSRSDSSSPTGADTNVTVPATDNGNGSATATMSTNSANQMVNNAVKNKSKNVIITVTAPANATNISIISMSMPRSAAKYLFDRTSATLTVVMPFASVTFTHEAVGNLIRKGTQTVGVAIEKIDDTFQVTVQADGNAVAELDGMKVSFPVDEKVSMGIVAIRVNPDGSETIIKKRIPLNGALTFALNGSATIRIKDNSKAFPDIEGHWATDSIQFVTGRELFNGVSETSFAPNSPMTRAMLVTVLHRLEDIPAGGTLAFSDTAAGLWYSDAVAWASGKGIANGNPDGTFCPNEQITREQLATMLYRYATSIGIETNGASNQNPFADSNQVSGYAMKAISWAVEKGIINGKSHDRLDPKGNTTRAEVATMLMRLVGIMQ